MNNHAICKQFLDNAREVRDRVRQLDIKSREKQVEELSNKLRAAEEELSHRREVERLSNGGW